MLKRLFCVLSALAICSAVALADGQKVTLTGHLVDKACSARVAKKENPQEAAGAHTRNCSLTEGCAKSGFGVFADGKYTEFDEKSNAMARAALEKSSKDKGASFKVTGRMVDGKLAVESITEAQ